MHHVVLSTGYNAWSNMHRCPLVTRHNLISKAVGKDINIPSSIVAKYGLPIHIVHAHSGLDVTWVDFVPCIGSYVRIDPLKVQSELAYGNPATQWVLILLFHNRTKCWFQDLQTT